MEEICPSVLHAHQSHDDIEPLDEKATVEHDEKIATTEEPKPLDAAIRSRLVKAFGRNVEDIPMTPMRDVEVIGEQLTTLSEEEARDILLNTIQVHQVDPNFPGPTMDRIRVLVQGAKASDMDHDDWLLELKVEAAIIHFHSPYPEVRSATLPYDDPSEPVETIRVYLIGLALTAGSAFLNTVYSVRQPPINLGANVLQILVVMLGKLWARVIPDWGFSFRGNRISLNPGPWTLKETVLASIFFNIATGTDSVIQTLLIQSLPSYLQQPWINYGYEVLLALSTRLCGYGFAGLLRRFVIYPQTAVFPSVLPRLVLCRALVSPEKRETINGWKMSRLKFFWLTGTAMFIWFWIPNTLFTALRSFNWMTWIAPQNFTLAAVTGFYGGLGLNPWATFDWNVAGQQSLTTPFFSTLQQYIAKLISAFVILGIYYSNRIWAAYMPLTSNTTFTATQTKYDIYAILGDNYQIDIAKYQKYGPPYFPVALIWQQGSRMGWYTLSFSYYAVTMGREIWNTTKSMFSSLRSSRPAFDEYQDSHSRMMRRYPEVPDWWFLGTLVISIVLGIAACAAWDTHVPWWSIICVAAMTTVLVIPTTIMLAVANVNVGYNVLFEIMGGLWFPGNPTANLMVTAYGENFNDQADNYIADLKLAHYARLPQRAVFRGQIAAVLVGSFVWVGALNWLVNTFDDGTLCTQSNAQHFVCPTITGSFSTAIEYGAYGTRNVFAQYPFMLWGLLIGAVAGSGIALVQTQGWRIRDYCRRHWREDIFYRANRWCFHPLTYFKFFNPAVFWVGAITWAGSMNLSYKTNAVYISFAMMYYVKRRYTSWWEKYNYLLEASFGVGLALSALVQTLALRFGKEITLDWWGNKVSQAGVDYQLYQNKAFLVKLKKGEHFGLPKDEWPMNW